jgi:hypothetical protein
MSILQIEKLAKLNESEKIKYIQGLINQGENHSLVRKEVGRAWGIGKSARNEKFNKIIKGAVTIKDCGNKIYTVESKKKEVLKINGNTAVAEVKGIADIVTVEDLIAYAQIDTSIWECWKSSANVWNGMWQVKAEFKKKVDEQSLKSLIETFTKQATERAPKNFKINPVKGSGDGLYVLSIQDLHIGKLAHGKQTSWGDYDLSIAKKYYLEAAEELINKAPIKEIGKILLIIGSDMIHYENQRVETSSGTKIEGDSRWHKVFDESCQLVADTIELLASQFDVEVMVVAGNHANLSEYAMGAYIKAFFRFHPNVNVNNEPSNRKYFGHGKTLVGFAHGHGVKKLEDLGAVMMRERMDTISNFKNLYWITGHKHTFTQMKDDRGIRIFVSSALCAPDQWHSENNLTGNIQSAEGYLFSPETGLSQIIFTSPVNIR